MVCMAQECKKKAVALGKPDMVRVAHKPDRFIFTVEVSRHLSSHFHRSFTHLLGFSLPFYLLSADSLIYPSM